MKVSESKICHKSNHTKIIFNQKYKCFYLADSDDVIKLMTCNTQTVTIITGSIIMHCSITL